MEFYLKYSGILKLRSNIREKHKIRKMFHSQLSELADYLKTQKVGREEWFNSRYRKEVGTVHFQPMIPHSVEYYVKLEVLILSPLQHYQGDIDNVAKVLIDSLRVPSKSELGDYTPVAGETPFYALLEDDKVVKDLVMSQHKLFHSIVEEVIIKVTICPNSQIL